MITPELNKVRGLFQSTDRLEVPIYQRKFEWRESEAVELLDDLNSNNDTSGTFLGTIILKQISDGDEIHEIVDGQQRLTTLSILFLALRMSLGSGATFEKIGRNLFNVNDDNETQPILKPSPSIERLYNHIMQVEWDGTFPEKIGRNEVKRQIKRIKPIYEAFKKYIDSKVDDEDWVKYFVSRINNCYFITIKASTEEDIYEIFERSNARGLQLGLGDLLRNFVASNEDDSIFEAWQEISDNAESSLPKILKYFIVCRYGYTPKSEVYKTIKKHIGDKSSNRLEDFLNELADFTGFYMESQKDHVRIEPWLEKFYPQSDELKPYDIQEVNRVLGALRFFKVSQPLPLIYNLTGQVLTGGVKKGQYIKLLQTLENFHCVNTLVLNGAANQMEMVYARWAPMVKNGDHVYDEIINTCRKEIFNKEAFVNAFREEIMYSSSKEDREAVIYFIDKIENYRPKSPRKGDEYEYLFKRDGRKKSSNIEHILSKSSGNDPEIDYFGNLLYIPIQSNSRLGNMPPAEKREVLLKDPSQSGRRYHVKYWYDSFQGGDESWDIDAIVKRTNQLAELFYEEILKIQ